MRQQHIPLDDDRLMRNELFELALPSWKQLAIGGIVPIFSLLVLER
jgi:hypothetical protein